MWRVIACLFLIASTAQAAQVAGDAVFAADQLHTIELRLTAKNWDALQPLRDNRRFRATTLPADEEVHQSLMGMRFPIVRANLLIDGKPIDEVGVRFKGNSSYVATARSLRRPMLLDFNHYRDQTLDGLRQLNLNPNVLDPSGLRETLSYQFFRQAGVPAPRTALGQAFLSVEGIYDRVPLGAYTLIEDVDRHFLKSRFKSEDGLLLKPEGVSNFRYIGEDFTQYLPYYRPRTDVSPELSARIIDFSKLVTKADDAEFESRLEQYLDIREFLRFIAVNVLAVNYDSILGMAHNYYIYISPDDRRLHFIPWDLNLSIGGYVRMGEPMKTANMDIHKPWVGQNRLLERLMATPRFKAIYLEEMTRLNQTLLNPQPLEAQIRSLEKMIGRVRPTTQPTAMVDQQAPEIAAFLRARYESVQRQLAGDRTGVLAPRFTSQTISGQLRWK